MPPSRFVRQGGLASVVGSVAYAAGVSFSPLGGFGYWFDRAHTLLLGVLLLGVLAALAALARLLYVSRGENGGYRRLGMLVSLATLVGVALLFSGTVIEALVGPPAQQETPFERGLGRFVPLLAATGMLGATGGLLVLGTLALGSGALPRWCGAMFFVGSPPVWLLLATVETPVLLAVPALAWALVGYALFQAEVHPPPQQPSRVS